MMSISFPDFGILDLSTDFVLSINEPCATLFFMSLQSSFGDAILEAIAWTYENYATQYLGKLDTFLGLGGR